MQHIVHVSEKKKKWCKMQQHNVHRVRKKKTKKHTILGGFYSSHLALHNHVFVSFVVVYIVKQELVTTLGTTTCPFRTACTPFM